jgi:hypothetical protein
VKPYFDPAVEIYLEKYKNHFPFPGFRDQEFREGEKYSVEFPFPGFRDQEYREGEKYSVEFPFPGFRDQEYREGEKYSVEPIPLPRLQGSGVQGR